MGLIGVTFDRYARPLRDLVRWAARWLALIVVVPATGPPRGRLADAVDALAASPRWAPLLLLLPALWFGRRATWAALGEYLAADDAGGPHVTVADQRPLRLGPWRDRGFLAVRLALAARASAVCALAAASGWGSVLLGRDLVGPGSPVGPGLAGYAAVAAAAVALSWLEAVPFLPWWPRRPPSRAEAAARLEEYRTWFPAEARTAAALLYASSRLDRRGVTVRVARFTPAPRAAHLAALALTALLFTLAPAPSVDGLPGAGLLRRWYVAGVGCFTTGGWLGAGWVVVLLLAVPVPVLWALVRFGLLWRLPPGAVGEVLRRERGPARQAVAAAAWRAAVRAVAGAAALWLSAFVAARTGSAAAGVVTLAAAGLPAAYVAHQLTRRR